MSVPAAMLDHVAPALLVVFRLGGLTFYGPALGAAVVPVRVKVFLSLLIGLAVYPMLAATGAAVTHRLELWALAPLLACELLIGLVIGFMASLPMTAAQAGGLVMGQQMGLGFGQFFNPAIDDEADVLGQILFFLTLAAFLMLGGHEAMLAAVLQSFHHVPLGGAVMNEGILALLGGMLNSSIELALRVAAPLLALVFLETVALGFLSKTVPQLNILSLGFTLRILAGIAVVLVGLRVIHEVLVEGVDETLALFSEWIGAAGG
jgi:flagellar biosynthetic protein FliR